MQLPRLYLQLPEAKLRCLDEDRQAWTVYFHTNRNFNILGLTFVVPELQADGKDALYKGRFKCVLPIIFLTEKKISYFECKDLASRKSNVILIGQNSLYTGLLPSSTSWSSVRTRMMFGRMFLRSLWNLPFRRWFNRKVELPSNSDKTVIVNNPRTILCCAMLCWFNVLSEQGNLTASISFSLQVSYKGEGNKYLSIFSPLCTHQGTARFSPKK